MYLSVGVVAVLVLVAASPLIWVAWWLLADLGQRASGRDNQTTRSTTRRRYIPAA
ncbi:MAG TPA: hypothetical protein VF383_01395 [Candidatus Dormibacteraeota bacterium]